MANLEFSTNFREVIKEKLWKSGQADHLGWSPPPPWSSQENVNFFDFDFGLWLYMT